MWHCVFATPKPGLAAAASGESNNAVEAWSVWQSARPQDHAALRDVRLLAQKYTRQALTSSWRPCYDRQQ